MGPPAAVAEVRSAVRRVLAGVQPQSLVLVACSGGPDSMALAAASAFEAVRAQLRCGAVTVDHQLQDGSGERAAKVARSLLDLGLAPVEIRPVAVGRSGGPEAAARAARYAALGEAADRLGAAVVLLGHTRDDQAETVLLGLARGSGARSLAGMAPESGIYRRPLLDVARATVRAAAQGLPVWDDPHNEDPAFARSRVRGQVLPTLEAALGPGVADALARTAKLLRADADALDDVALSTYTSMVLEGEQAEHVEVTGLDVSVLVELQEAIRTRVLRRALLAAGSAATDLTAAHVGAVDALLTDWHGQGPIHLPQGVRASRACGRLLLERE